MNGKHIIFIFLFVLNLSLKAQEIQYISLEELLEQVENDNLSIKINEESFNAAQAEFTQTNRVLFPTIAISHTGMVTNNPLMAFGTKLNQEIVSQADFAPNLLNDPSSIENFSTKIEIQQPIFNADGLFMRKASKAKMGAMEYQYLRSKQAMKLEMTKAFMQLQIAYEIINVLELAHKTASAHKKVAQDYYVQGFLQKSDLLEIKVYETEIKNKLITAQSNVKNTSDIILNLIGQQSSITLKPKATLSKLTDLILETREVSSMRLDIAAFEKNVEATEYMYRASKSGYLPRFNAFGSYELHDDQLFAGNAKGYMVGAQLSWNIFEGFNRIGSIKKSKASYNGAKLSLEKYKNDSQVHFDKVRRQLKDAENKMALTQLAVEQSKEALRIRTNRFKEGLEKTADVLSSETTYLQKQFEKLQTIFEYNFTKSYLDFLSK